MNKMIAMVLMLSLIGNGGSKIDRQSAAYSNLADEASRTEVAAVLESSGLYRQQIETVFAWVEDFNEISRSYEFKEGFQPLPKDGMDYSTLSLDDTAENYAYLQWLNCRLTAFSLLKDQITTAKNGSDTDVWLMFDIEAIDTVPELQMSAQERSDFITLFQQVSVEGTASIEEHEEKIQEAWQERGIHLAADKVSLICVYLHALEDRVRFVGHTGVLAEMENGLMFVEKYSNLDPFQATYFRDREELKQYLLSRNDLYGDQTELAPIVAENGIPF